MQKEWDLYGIPERRIMSEGYKGLGEEYSGVKWKRKDVLQRECVPGNAKR